MPAATATTAGSAPSAAASSTTVEPSSTAGSPPSAEVSVALPLVLCPDVHGVGSPSGATLPSTILESVPSTVVHQLAVYTTQQDVLQVLGPTGWECSASESYDGKTSVDIYPKGSADPAKGSFEPSSGEGVIGSRTGGCVSCALTQASPLFPAAKRLCARQERGGSSACLSHPAHENVMPVAGNVMGFFDPLSRCSAMATRREVHSRRSVSWCSRPPAIRRPGSTPAPFPTATMTCAPQCSATLSRPMNQGEVKGPIMERTTCRPVR